MTRDGVDGVLYFISMDGSKFDVGADVQSAPCPLHLALATPWRHFAQLQRLGSQFRPCKQNEALFGIGEGSTRHVHDPLLHYSSSLFRVPLVIGDKASGLGRLS
jgi:hypothetical protein